MWSGVKDYMVSSCRYAGICAGRVPRLHAVLFLDIRICIHYLARTRRKCKRIFAPDPVAFVCLVGLSETGARGKEFIDPTALSTALVKIGGYSFLNDIENQSFCCF